MPDPQTGSGCMYVYVFPGVSVFHEPIQWQTLVCLHCSINPFKHRIRTPGATCWRAKEHVPTCRTGAWPTHLRDD